MKDKPTLSARQLSSGYWINVNLGIKDLVLTIGRLCRFCGVDLKNVFITYVPKQSSSRHEQTIIFEGNSTQFAQQKIRDDYKAWLIKHNPKWGRGTVAMYCSNVYYLNNYNISGITLEEALTAEDGLERTYEAIKQFYIQNPTLINNPIESARYYVRTLRLFKEFLKDEYPELLRKNNNTHEPTSVLSDSVTTVPDSLIETLKKNYSAGFRFETTYINLLSNVSGINVDESMQSALKRIMFHREDNIYFLLDMVADAEVRENIVEFADDCLQEYGCFEIPELFKLYEDEVNTNCIRNADDFENFYEQIGRSGVRCVQAPYIGNRIARYCSGSVWGTFKELAAKIVRFINEKYYGSCSEDDLHAEFCMFSTDLLGKIVKYSAADDLICVEINDIVCYQAFDALGLPENFSDLLAETLERLGDIGLEPSRDILHTAISLRIGVNFMTEYNLPDWDTFQRLISALYKAEPRREWRHYLFGEVAD